MKRIKAATILLIKATIVAFIAGFCAATIEGIIYDDRNQEITHP